MMKVIVPNDMELLSCSVAETDAADGAVWQAGATYAKGAKVRHGHVSYTSLADGNTGNEPAKTWSGDDAKWKRLDATMPWRMFDEYVETQTVGKAGEHLTFCVNYDRCDAFALLNLEGFDLRAHVYDLDGDPDVPVWPSELDFLNDIGHVSLWEYLWLPVTSAWRLVRDISKLSLYEYNYSPIIGAGRFFRTATAMPLHGKLCVDIDPGHSEIASAVGKVVVGRAYDLGWTQYDAELGFTDYSRKTTDDFGRTTIIRRAYTHSMSLPLYLHPDQADYVEQILSDVRGKPCVWVGDNVDKGFQALTQYGWLEDFRMVYAGPNEMQLSLEIQGLI